MKIIAILALPLAMSACTFTQAGNSTPVVLTAATAGDFIKTEMAKGCSALMNNPAAVQIAVAVAIKALNDTSGTVAAVSNAACGLSCILLVPPPIVVGATGG